MSYSEIKKSISEGSVLSASKRISSNASYIDINKRELEISIKIRYDDECGNKHNTFSITGEVYDVTGGKLPIDRNMIAGGCVHDYIIESKHPWAKYIKWHGISSDGPLQYLANTTYHASDRKDMTKALGEPVEWKEAFRFKGIPFTYGIGKYGDKFSKDDICLLKQKNMDLLDCKIVPVKHITTNGYQFSDKYTFNILISEGVEPTWYKCQFDTVAEAQEWIDMLSSYEIEIVNIPVKWNEARVPNLEGARSCAIWPEGTLEQLQDEQALLERLPALMEEFKEDLNELGLTF